MNQIQHVDQNIYCVSIGLDDIKTSTNTSTSAKKINHLLVLDNVHIKNDLVTIINNYAFIIDRYIKTVNIDCLYLITTYPKMKVTKVDKNKLYTELRKVINNNSCHIELQDVYVEIFNECNKIINSDEVDYTEIVIFTNMSHNLSNESKTLLIDMSANINININIICNHDFITLPKINRY
mgnify:CR=1 FL=1